jgi:hypothetical protein
VSCSEKHETNFNEYDQRTGDKCPQPRYQQHPSGARTISSIVNRSVEVSEAADLGRIEPLSVTDVWCTCAFQPGQTPKHASR